MSARLCRQNLFHFITKFVKLLKNQAAVYVDSRFIPKLFEFEMNKLGLKTHYDKWS